MNCSPYLKLCRIEFIVTYRCTGRCKHCSVSGKLNNAGDCEKILIPQAREAIKKLSGMFNITSVMTFGGEPLLYSGEVSEIHKTARECSIETRQIITNGYFSKDEAVIEKTAKSLYDAGVNNVLVSVDSFHQENIPEDIVYSFVKHMKNTGIEKLALHPAFIHDISFENEYNTKTRGILSHFEALEVPVSRGNIVSMAGNAIKYLSSFYESPCIDMSQPCGTSPYTHPLTEITALSILPNGDVKICGFVIGNIYKENIEDIVCRYNPYENEWMNAVLSGGAPALIEKANEKNLDIDYSRCYSVCDLCHKINIVLNT